MIVTKFSKNLQNFEKTLFFLAVLFLPTQLGKHFWPEFSSIYSLRIDYLSPTIYFWDLLVLGLISLCTLHSFLYPKKTKLNLHAGLLLLFFLVTQIVSIINATNPEASFVRLKDYLVAVCFGLYIASSNLKDIKGPLISALLISVIFSCFLGVVQFLKGGSIGLWILGERGFSVTTPLIAKFNFYDRIFLRPYATFPHPNILAGFLVTSLPLLLAGLPGTFKAVKPMLILLISSTVFITFSRPGLVLASVYSIIIFRKFWKFLAILAVIIMPLVFVRFSSIFTYDTLAVLRRQELSDYAIKLFLENPLLGVGLNNFVNVLASDHVLVGTSRFWQPVHNIFLLVLAESGILGLIGFLTLLSLAILENIRKKTIFSQATVASLIMVVFLGLFDHYFLTLPQGQRIFFTLIGLSLISDFNGKKT